MNSRILPLLILTSLWPVWSWMFSRLTDHSDDPFGLVALLAAVILSRTDGAGAPSLHAPVGTALLRRPPSHDPDQKQLSLISITLIAYAVTAPFLPMLIRATFAMLAVALVLSWYSFHQRLNLSIFGLCILALPVVATLQFYLGHPFRLIVAHGAQLLLYACNYATQLSGTDLVWQSQIVGIDPACSGIKMLWTGLFAACVLAALNRLSTPRTLLLCASTFALVLLTNTLRATTLFLLQVLTTQLSIPEPDLLHSAVGLTLFLLLLAVVGVGAAHLRRPSGNTSANTSESTSAHHVGGTALPRRPLSNENTSDSSSKSTRGADREVRPYATAALCVVILLMPFMAPSTAAPQITAATPITTKSPLPFPNLTRVPLSSSESSFAANFPGTIAKYTSGPRQYIIRTVSQPTRQLHPSEDCFKGSGFRTKALPNFRDAENHTWGTFSATKPNVTLIVHERISDSEGNSWTDVSSWYWSCVFQKTRGPWLSITVAEPLSSPPDADKNAP